MRGARRFFSWEKQVFLVGFSLTIPRFPHKSKNRLNTSLLPGETKVFINESLCLYYKKLWPKCKSLWSAGHISAFWVRNGSLRIKLSNGSVSIITHDCDLEKLFPDNSLIEDNYVLTDFNIFS